MRASPAERGGADASLDIGHADPHGFDDLGCAALHGGHGPAYLAGGFAGALSEATDLGGDDCKAPAMLPRREPPQYWR